MTILYVGVLLIVKTSWARYEKWGAVRRPVSRMMRSSSSSSWTVGRRQRVVVVIVAALLLLLLVASSSASSASSRAGTTDDGDDAELQTLLRRAHEMMSQDAAATTNDDDDDNNNAGAEYEATWKRIRKLRPRWAEANARYGMILLGAPRASQERRAIELLRRSIDVRSVDDPIPPSSTEGMIIATTVGRYYHSIDMTKRAIPMIDNVHDANRDDLCLALMSGTMILHQVPTSMEEEDEIVGEYLVRTNAVLTRLTRQRQQQQQQQQSRTRQQSQTPEIWTMDERYLSRTFPGAASDPYEHCMISEFLWGFFFFNHV